MLKKIMFYFLLNIIFLIEIGLNIILLLYLMKNEYLANFIKYFINRDIIPPLFIINFIVFYVTNLFLFKLLKKVNITISKYWTMLPIVIFLLLQNELNINNYGYSYCEYKTPELRK